MPARRIIPCLDVKDGRVVKGVQFRDHRDAGDIVEQALRYRDEGADELVFYDISASAEGRPLAKEWVRQIARVIDQVLELAARGIRSGINMLVPRSRLTAAEQAARQIREAGIANDEGRHGARL